MSLADLGSTIDPATLMPGLMPVGGREGDVLVGEVLWVDHFGNVQLNLVPADLDGFEGELVLAWAESSRRVERVSTFSQISPGTIGLMVDSYGLLTLAAARGSAADELRINEGDQVRISDSGQPVGINTPVELGGR